MTPSYFTRYENLAMQRSDSGILTVRFHTDGGPIVFTGQMHRELPKALAEIGDDRDNKVVILTGTGDVFMEEIDGRLPRRDLQARRVGQDLLGGPPRPTAPARARGTDHRRGQRPGHRAQRVRPARGHHRGLRGRCVRRQAAVGFGIVPGDGIHVIYEELLGVNRARYFALTQQRIEAKEAQTLGLVNEVVPKSAVYDRAFAIAQQLAEKPQLFLRYTTLALRQRLLQRLNVGTQLGMALEGLTAADLAYQQQEVAA